LMHISEKLADLNWERTKLENPLLWKCTSIYYTFDGDVYTGLDAYTIPVDKIPVLQDKLRILSGLYGF
jgi:cytoplasmic iron level regulating protein YaaA (DUF328/UPF0246 family)